MKPQRSVMRPLLAAALLVPLIATAGGAAVGAVQRGQKTSVTCQVCHGQFGEGLPAKGYPRLAGQYAAYIEQQLRDFRTGRRRNEIMRLLANTYDDGQRADIAAYFASLPIPAPAGVTPYDAATLTRGRRLARSGDESLGLQACANCHGPDGSGEPLTSPYLAGQPARYLEGAIDEWRSGARRGSQMAEIVSRLSKRDAAAAATYFEALGHVRH